MQQPELPGLEVPTRQRPEPEPEQTIQERFEDFHRRNPWVLVALEDLTADCVAAGFQRVSIGMLFEVLRWRHDHGTTGGEFRLNNSYRSRYVRLLLEHRPEWRPLFEVRVLRAD